MCFLIVLMFACDLGHNIVPRSVLHRAMHRYRRVREKNKTAFDRPNRNHVGKYI